MPSSCIEVTQLPPPDFLQRLLNPNCLISAPFVFKAGNAAAAWLISRLPLSVAQSQCSLLRTRHSFAGHGLLFILLAQLKYVPLQPQSLQSCGEWTSRWNNSLSLGLCLLSLSLFLSLCLSNKSITNLLIKHICQEKKHLNCKTQWKRFSLVFETRFVQRELLFLCTLGLLHKPDPVLLSLIC